MYEVREGGSHWVRGFTGALVIVTAVLGFVVWSPVRTPVTEFGFHASLVDQGPAPAVAPGTTTTYSMHFRNTGLVAWQRGTEKQVTLGVSGDATTYADAGMAVGWLAPARIVTTSEDFVLPGTVGTFTFKVRAPMTPGLYRVPVRLVVDGLAWLDHDPVTVEITSDLGFHSRLVDQSAHVVLKPGELSAPLTVRIRNSGAKPWTLGLPGQQANLGIAGDDRALTALGVGWPSADRVAIQAEPSVGPGAIATFTFRVRAPLVLGTYALRLRPVVDGLMWLEDDGIVTLVTVVSPSGATATPVPGEAFKNVQPTTFEFAAAADPQSVAAGGAVKITATFRSATVGTAFVGVEVYAPGGTTLAYQKWFPNESFAAGEQRTYTTTWQVPNGAALGTYSVDASAYSPGWKTLYGSRPSAATVVVNAAAFQPGPPPATASPAPSGQPTPAQTATSAPTSTPGSGVTSAPSSTPAPTQTPSLAPTFTMAASAAPASVAAGSSVGVTALITGAVAASALVDIEIYAPGGTTPVNQVWFDNQSFAAGQQRSYAVTWQVPASAAFGTYTVQLAVFSPGWVTAYSPLSPATTFSVTAPAPSPTPTPAPSGTAAATPTPTVVPTATPVPTPVPAPTPGFTSTATAVPTSVAPGGTVTVTVPVTSITAMSVLVDVEVYAPDLTTLVKQASFDNQSFTAGQQRTYTVSWQVSSSAVGGTYTVDVGVFGVGWKTLYSWTQPAVLVTVLAPSATPTPLPTPTPVPTPTPLPTPTPGPTATPSPIPSGTLGLRVQGNHLIDASGQVVVLVGMNRSGTEYACSQGWGIFDGPNDSASIQAMKAWKINTIRVPLNEDCWLGINGVASAYSGANYQQAIRNYVNVINQNGLYVMLDLHWTAPGTTKTTDQVPMPDMDHSPTFWSQVANAYRNNPAVVFELFNEPYPDDGDRLSDAAWRCLRDGGTCPGVSFQAAGMQTLVNAVRSTGATNVIATAIGVGWNTMPQRWLQYRPTDPMGNMMVAWHVYNVPWVRSIGSDTAAATIALQYPLVVTELGPSSTCDLSNTSWMMDWLDAHGAGYLAWVWNTWGSNCGSKALITDYSGTTTTWGQLLKSHLAAR